MGYTSTLKIYTNTFLGTGYGDSTYIDQSFGKILQETANRFLLAVPPSERNVAQVQQNVLQGDPAALLFGANKPDYSISNNDISIIPVDDEPITTLSDSFEIAIVVRNFGILLLQMKNLDGAKEIFTAYTELQIKIGNIKYTSKGKIRKYGFIQPDDKSPDIYFNEDVFLDSRKKEFRKGVRVIAVVEMANKGPRAIYVSKYNNNLQMA